MSDVRKRILVSAAVALALLLLAGGPAFAGPGKIAGVVKDAQTGQALIGANVTIEGTTMGASTDDQGRYFVLNIPVGTYTVRASILGYKIVRQENIKVVSDLTTELNFSLQTTVIEGEEVVVTAERPLVDKFLTATKATIDAKELDNNLPVGSLAEIIETTPSAFGGYIRGGRKYETKTLLDGINISDSYFSGGTGGGGQVYQTYTATRRSEGNETNVADPTAGSVQELAVLAGTFAAEYDAASAGIINITTKSGGSRLSGKLFLRSSLSGLDHAGPNVYNDLNRFFAERDVNLASTNAGNQERGRLMTFSQSTIDDIGYGDDRAIDGELSLGGPLTSKGNFYFSGRLRNDHGRFPGEFNREMTSSLKLNYNLANNKRLSGNIIVNDGGILGGWKNQTFSSRFKFFPEGNAQNEKLGLVGYLNYTHTLSPKTFFEIRGSYTGRTSRFGYSDDDNDGKIERGENGDFLIIETPQESEKYLGVGGNGRLPDGSRSFFAANPGNEPFFTVAYSLNQYRYGQPGFYYEELKRNALQIKADITSQVTFHHQLKGGLLYKRHSIEDFFQRTQVGGFSPAFPFEEIQFDVKPTEFAAYVQDRIEYEGVIINAGLRVDGYKPGAKQFGNFFNVATRDTLDSGRILIRQNRTEDVPTRWFFGPRIGISHPISESAVMHYAWGRFFSPPPFASLFDELGVWSNPSLPVGRDVDLDPPEATAYEIGLQWSIAQDYAISTTAYYRDIKNYGSIGYQVIPATGSGFGSYTYVTSFGYGDSRGIEVSLQKRPAGWLSGRFSYAFSYIKAAAYAGNISANQTTFSAASSQTIPFDDRYQFNTYSKNITGGGNALDSGFDREHRLSLTFLLDLPFDVDVTGISSAQSGFWYDLSVTGSDPRERQQERSPWTYQTDLRLTKGFNLGGARLGRIFFEGRNIFDKQNILAYDASTIPGVRLWEEKQDPTGELRRATTADGVSLFDIAREFYFGIDFSF